MVFLCLIFLHFVQSYNKIHAIDNISNVRIWKSRYSCKLVGHDLSLNFSFVCNTLKCQFEVLFLSFISFVSKALSNSFELLLLHIVTLFLLSIGYACFYNLSSKLKTVCYVLVSYYSILLPLCILLSY